MTEQNEQNLVALLIEKTKKHLKKHPNINSADFANGYLFPIIEQMMEAIDELGSDVDDLFDAVDVPEKSLVDETSATLLDLVGFIDVVLIRAGWLSTKGPTEAFPTDLQQRFISLQASVASTVDRLRQYGDGDEGGVEQEEDEIEAAAEEDDIEAVEEESPVAFVEATDNQTEINGVAQ